jgi:hypothetical protein
MFKDQFQRSELCELQVSKQFLSGFFLLRIFLIKIYRYQVQSHPSSNALQHLQVLC